MDSGLVKPALSAPNTKAKLLKELCLCYFCDHLQRNSFASLLCDEKWLFSTNIVSLGFQILVALAHQNPLVLRCVKDFLQPLCVLSRASQSKPAPGFLLHIAAGFTVCVCSNTACSGPHPPCVPSAVLLQGFSVTHNQQRPNDMPRLKTIHQITFTVLWHYSFISYCCSCLTVCASLSLFLAVTNTLPKQL